MLSPGPARSHQQTTKNKESIHEQTAIGDSRRVGLRALRRIGLGRLRRVHQRLVVRRLPKPDRNGRFARRGPARQLDKQRGIGPGRATLQLRRLDRAGGRRIRHHQRNRHERRGQHRDHEHVSQARHAGQRPDVGAHEHLVRRHDQQGPRRRGPAPRRLRLGARDGRLRQKRGRPDRHLPQERNRRGQRRNDQLGPVRVQLGYRQPRSGLGRAQKRRQPTSRFSSSIRRPETRRFRSLWTKR